MEMNEAQITNLINSIVNNKIKETKKQIEKDIDLKFDRLVSYSLGKSLVGSLQKDKSTRKKLLEILLKDNNIHEDIIKQLMYHLHKNKKLRKKFNEALNDVRD